MKSLIKIPGALVFMLAAATNATAGIYANLEVGNSDTGESEFETDTGYKFGFGAKINDNFSVEINYVDFGTFDVKSKYLGVLSQEASADLGEIVTVHSADVDVSGLDISLLGFVPINDQFSFFGRIGILSWDADFNFSLSVQGQGSGSFGESEDGNDLSFGLGLQFKPSENLGLTFGYDKYDFDMEDDNSKIDFIHAGLKFYFDK